MAESTTCPRPVLLPGVQRDQRAERREDRGELVTQRDAAARRRLVGITGDVTDSAHRLADRAEAGPRGVGTVLAESGDPGDDQPRVDLPQLLRAESPAFERPGPEVLQQDVALGDEPAHHVLAFRHSQVAGDRLLVASDEWPPQRPPVRLLPAPLPHRIAARRVLDLDHLGAEVAEQLTAERTGEKLSEFDDPNIGERQRQRHEPRASVSIAASASERGAQRRTEAGGWLIAYLRPVGAAAGRAATPARTAGGCASRSRPSRRRRPATRRRSRCGD